MLNGVVPCQVLLLPSVLSAAEDYARPGVCGGFGIALAFEDFGDDAEVIEGVQFGIGRKGESQ